MYECEVFLPKSFNISIDTNIKLRVRPQYISQSGKWVKVRWYNNDRPSNGDWIGVYSPPMYDSYPIDPVSYAPIKYQWANVSTSHTTYGRGSMSMRLLNMRSPLVMGFFRGGFETPTLIAYSNIIYFKNYNEPAQLHLSLTSNENELMVTWVSNDLTRPVIYWGTVSGSYTQVTWSESSSYNASDMCSSPAIDFGYRAPGAIHSAILSNLEPGELYYYTVENNCTWSQEFSFTAPPSSNQYFTMIAYGESGCAQQDGTYSVYDHRESLNVTSHVISQIDNIDMLLHLGGLSYARGYSSVWDTFFDQIEPIASTIPYMVAAGVAEVGKNLTNCSDNTECGGECGVPFMNRFNMPWSSEDNGYSPWYDFDYGSVHFVVISTEHDFTSGSSQYQFIVNSLQNVDRSTTPWVIVAGHRPMYTVSYQDSKEQLITDSLQANLEPLLNAYQVDLALWSYQRSYQRTCSVYRGHCMEDTGETGTVHLVVGTGGAQLESNSSSSSPIWLKYTNNEDYGYVKLSVAPSVLKVAFISSNKNATVDSFEIETSFPSGDFLLDDYPLEEPQNIPSDYKNDKYLLQELQDIPRDFMHDAV